VYKQTNKQKKKRGKERKGKGGLDEERKKKQIKRRKECNKMVASSPTEYMFKVMSP
jgi:hypothetical protein